VLITSLIDDIDGTSAQETVQFSLDGVSYEIDLNGPHAEELRTALAVFVAAARKTPATSRRRGRPRADRRPGAAQVRAWAREQGIRVNGRGSIQADIMDKYLAAH
jgi:hypothetical protein